MPFALTGIGLILIITGFQNTYKEFGSEVQGDFTGQNNFLYWLISILIVGSIGYVKGLETFSRAFMALIIIALILDKKSGTAQGITFFTNLASGLSSGSTSAVNPIGDNVQGGASSTPSNGNSSTSDSGAGNLLSDFNAAAAAISLF